MPYAAAIYPEYLADHNLFVCPSSARLTEEDVYDDTGLSILAKPNTSDVWRATYCYSYMGYSTSLKILTIHRTLAASSAPSELHCPSKAPSPVK